ncbi:MULTISPECIES: hypothetical protein [unclassified Arthrobacter]|nr:MULTISPECIES: hypothetical protein [unclassified Arthrobacter]
MNTVPEAGEPVEPFRVVIGFNNQELSAYVALLSSSWQRRNDWSSVPV